MAQLVSKATIEEIRARCDIADIVGSYIELKRGGSALKALCPFHKEKTPSFTVNSHRQIFHCFGCGVGGDVFRFVMEYENVDFPTAIRMLAERAGVRLEIEEARDGPDGPRKDWILKTLDKSVELYQRVLAEHPSAEAARAYLQDRKLDGDPAAHFQIGYAPDIRGSLKKWAQQNKVSDELLVATGLMAFPEDGGSPYERFRGRVMFPIHDEMGRPVGFSGRILDPAAHPAKYVNSPETSVFRKNRILFALDKARHAMVDERVAIICEGQIDAIRCHEAGITNTVASQGTALSEGHARLVRRYADSVVLVLDADQAGQNAAIKSAEVFVGAGLTVRIATLPEGEDPDSLILSQGRDALMHLVEEARSVVDFQVGVLEKREDVATETGRNRTVQAALDTISRIPGAVQQDQMLRELSKKMYVAEHLLREDLRRMRSHRTAVDPIPTRRGDAHPPVEVNLLELMVNHPSVTELVRHYLPVEYFTDSDCRLIATEVLGQGDDPEWSLTAALSEAPPECQRLAAEAQMAPHRVVGEDATSEGAAQDFILRLRRAGLEQQRTKLRQAAEQAEGPERERLTAAFQQLSVDLSELKQGWDHAKHLLELD